MYGSRQKLDNPAALDAIQQILSCMPNNSEAEKSRALSEITQVVEHTGRPVV